jgi:hypothetical protein
MPVSLAHPATPLDQGARLVVLDLMPVGSLHRFGYPSPYELMASRNLRPECAMFSDRKPSLPPADARLWK